MKRFIASILSAAMLLNGLAPAYAAAEQDGKKSATVKHFTFTADVIPGKLEELEQYDVSMIDHGDVLENEEGVVVSEIQGTYYRNQKLTQSSLSGTSFAFAPIMLDNYFPLPEETPTPEPTVTPEPTITPEVSVTPEVSITPEASVMPDASVTPEASATPSLSPEDTDTPEPSESQEGEETPSPTEEPTEHPTDEPTEQPTEEPTEEPVEQPTERPTEEPAEQPTEQPTEEPTTEPTEKPEENPAEQPTEEPAEQPEEKPEQETENNEPEPEESPEEISEESADEPEEQPAGENAEENEPAQSASVWHWLFHAAHAEESAPSSIRGERQSYSRSAGCEWITYPGLFDAVTDVELSMTSTGIKENIIVNRYTGNHVYAYQMTTEGLTAAQNGREFCSITRTAT